MLFGCTYNPGKQGSVHDGGARWWETVHAQVGKFLSRQKQDGSIPGSMLGGTNPVRCHVAAAVGPWPYHSSVLFLNTGECDSPMHPRLRGQAAYRGWGAHTWHSPMVHAQWLPHGWRRQGGRWSLQVCWLQIWKSPHDHWWAIFDVLVQRRGSRRHINTKLCITRHVRGLWGLLFPLGGFWGCFLGIILTLLSWSLQLWNEQHHLETVFLVSFALKLIVSTPKISRQGGFWSLQMDEDVCCSQQDPCSTPTKRKENKSLHHHQNWLW